MKLLEEYNTTQPDRCGTCGGDIIWVPDQSGLCIPVDPAPASDGELYIIAGIIQPPLNDVFRLIISDESRYRQHVRSCPDLQGDEAIQKRIRATMAKAPHPHEIKTCSCGAKFFHAPSALGNNKHIPVCEQPSPTGNIFLNEQGQAVAVSKKNPAPDGATLYMSHFANCPQSAQFRSAR